MRRWPAGARGEVVDRVGASLDEYPHAEALIMALLRGLRAEGRTAEALEQYEVFRARLRAELGAGPGRELRELHAGLLTTNRGVSTRPAQLPAAPQGFVGRDEQLWELDSSRATVVVISGVPGVGKTALALTWAHRFPGGQLYADLGGGKAAPEVGRRALVLLDNVTKARFGCRRLPVRGW
jgi:hypothetical protein